MPFKREENGENVYGCCGLFCLFWVFFSVFLFSREVPCLELGNQVALNDEKL